MGKILVTGATGVVGKATIKHLLKKGVPANGIAGLARNAEKAEELLALGIEIRIGDYFDYDSLLTAFQGIEKVMLVSAHSFTDRFKQHYNAITAARQAGVQHIVYMSIMRKPGSKLVMPEVTESDIFSEQTLRASGVNYTVVFEPPFTEVLPFYYGMKALEKGIHLPGGFGKMAPATRDELAEAHAVILTTPGHENKSYSLGGSEALSFRDIAGTLAEVKGQPVPYSTISEEAYKDALLKEGIPPHLADFVLDWVRDINNGEYGYQSGDLERLLGRKTLSFREYLESQS